MYIRIGVKVKKLSLWLHEVMEKNVPLNNFWLPLESISLTMSELEYVRGFAKVSDLPWCVI